MITAEQYWTAVFGSRSASQIVAEFDLVDVPEQGSGSLDEWLSDAEAMAVSEATDGWPTMALLAEHHDSALEELRKACEPERVEP